MVLFIFIILAVTIILLFYVPKNHNRLILYIALSVSFLIFLCSIILLLESFAMGSELQFITRIELVIEYFHLDSTFRLDLTSTVLFYLLSLRIFVWLLFRRTVTSSKYQVMSLFCIELSTLLLFVMLDFVVSVLF